MTRILIAVISTFFAISSVHANEFEPSTMTVPTTSILDAAMLKGEHYTIAETVEVNGYMNHYTVDSEFGQFTAVGNRALKKLLHEIDAIAELRNTTSTSASTDAAIGVVTDTGKSAVNLAMNPVDSVKGMSAGASRFFKRTTRTAKNVGSEVADAAGDAVSDDDEEDETAGDDEADDEGLTTQLASSFMGIGKAHRKLARELKVDPYSNNAVLQEDLNRVAQVSGSVSKISKILMPIPSVVGTAADVSELVWNLSPVDLLIQNEEKLEAMGYSEELIKTFFSNPVFSPTEQTILVAALGAMDKVKGRDVLLGIANSAETEIEGEFLVRSILFVQLYHENVEPVAKLISVPNGLVPVAITQSGDGLIVAPLDHLLWTEEIATATQKLRKLIDASGAIDENLLWVEGQVSDMALARLNTNGWVESTDGFDKVEAMIKN